jgi:hypothetical protein
MGILMRFRAMARHDFSTNLVDLYIAEIGYDRRVARDVNDRGRIEYEESDLRDVPLISLEEGEAQAIYDALGVALNRTHPHAEQGRADFLHERGRVDKLMETISQIATRREVD